MYLLTIKDGLGTRHIGPYPSPKHASDDLDPDGERQTCTISAFIYWLLLFRKFEWVTKAV